MAVSQSARDRGASSRRSSPAPAAPEPDPAGYLALLRRHRDLRNLWLGHVVSYAGDWFNTIALYESVQSLSSHALALTLVMVAKTLPVFLVTPLTGPLIDRFDRRALLLGANVVRAACAAALIVASAAGSLAALYAATVLMMCGAGLAVPTKNAVLPTVVKRPLVPMANALIGGSWSIMLALGSAIGGVVAELLGVQVAFAVDCLTFVISGLFFWRLPSLPPPARAEGDSAPGFIAGFADGIRYLLGHRYILALTSLKPMMQLYGGMIAILPLFGTVVFAGASGPLYVGMLYAARGVGAAIGALVLRALFGDSLISLRRTIWVSYLVAGTAYASLALCSAFWQACLAILIGGISQSAIWVSSGSLLQIEADRAVHGRVFAVEFGTSMLTISLSSLAAGAALDAGLSIQALCAFFGLLAMIPLTLWSATLWRLRRAARSSGLRAHQR